MQEDNPETENYKPRHNDKGRHKKKNEPKPPKKISESYLHNSALYYLQRFAASKNHFRFVMMRKIKRSCAYHKEQDLDKCAKILESLIEQFESSGLLDDQTFARGLINSLRRRGLSQKAILLKAREKGLPGELAHKILEEHDLTIHDNQRDADFKAAILLARKKRLGPFTNPIKKDQEDEETARKRKDRQLSAMARAGYSYEISQIIMNMDLEEAEQHIYQML